MTIFNILIISAPLMAATLGALISEHAGSMALFLDGVINLGAFLCFAFTVKLGSPALGISCTVLVCTLFFLAVSRFIEFIKANSFIASLALNLLCNSLVSLLSSIFFGTRGILTSDLFSFAPSAMRFYTTLLSFALAALFAFFLFKTKTGLYIRITGSDQDVLTSRGVDVSWNRTISWSVAAGLGAVAGSILSLRLSSFVPNISSGRGWIALLCVFLGKKRLAFVAATVLIFSAAEYFATASAVLQSFNSAVILAFPYIITLALIVLSPKER